MNTKRFTTLSLILTVLGLAGAYGDALIPYLFHINWTIEQYANVFLFFGIAVPIASITFAALAIRKARKEENKPRSPYVALTLALVGFAMTGGLVIVSAIASYLFR